MQLDLDNNIVIYERCKSIFMLIFPCFPKLQEVKFKKKSNPTPFLSFGGQDGCILPEIGFVELFHVQWIVCEWSDM